MPGHGIRGHGESSVFQRTRFPFVEARLNFDALAYPCGGVGCLVALVETFGGGVTGIEDGAGLVRLRRSKTIPITPAEPRPRRGGSYFVSVGNC